MRVANPIKLTLPTQVVDRVGDVKNRDRYLYLAHYLLKQPIYDKRIDEENNGYININKEVVRKAIGCKPDAYIRNLVKAGVINRDNKYQPNSKSYWYKVNPDLINGSYSDILLDNKSPIYQNIVKVERAKRRNFNRLEPHLKKMQELITMHLEYDHEDAYRWIEENIAKDNITTDQAISYRIAVDQIADKRFRYFKRNKTNNRLDTNFTNLKIDLRQFIVGDYVQIDLRNSQPFFLAVLLSQLIDTLPTIEDSLYHKYREHIGDIPLCFQHTVGDIIN